MKVERITKISRGQDGAVWGRYLFRFQLDGCCHVYDLEDIKPVVPCGYQKAIDIFDLDRTDVIAPHSNCVCFGTEFYDPGDEFPLLYSNVYNSYEKQKDQRKGQCCVYRLQRDGNRFYTTLIQVIAISFTEDSGLWCSDDRKDVRPYGNFVIDRDSNKMYCFTMVDKAQAVRYFGFRIPHAGEGQVCRELGVKVVSLSPADILEQFDCPYQNYIQGACCHGGMVYSLEGLAEHPKQHALSVVSLREKKEVLKYNLFEAGLNIEPELIDFKDDICIFTDNFGNTYALGI